MPDATITSTASTFGTISGTFASDQSTITGTITGVVSGTLSGSVGVPGPQGPAGPGSTWGGIAGTLSNQTDLWTELGTKYLASNPAGYQTAAQVSTALVPYITSASASASFYPLTGNPSAFLTASALTPYLTKADNLGSLTNFATARDNLGLGSLSSPTFAGITAQGSGANVANLTPTSLSLTHATSGSFTIQPSVGIVFPDSSVQTTAYPGPAGATTWGSIVGTLSNQTDLQTALDGKASSARGLPPSGTVGQVLTKQSGTSYDANWATLIPGDRYVTTSTSTLSVSNGTKSLTIGTGLAYTPNQDVTISLTSDPTLHHMHGPVTSYNSGTGALVVDVQNHTGSGTFSSWTVNVGGTVPLETVEWGEVLGTLGDQTDLATALNAKLEITDAASTYQTISGMSSYLTTADAATTYYLQSNPAGYITSSALTGYATESWVTSQGYLTSSALTGYATESWVTAGFYPLTGNPSGFLTSSSLTGYATESWVTSQGYITSAALSPYLLSSTAASTYQTQAAMSAYLTTSAAATNYLAKSGGMMTGGLTFNPGAGGYLGTFQMLPGNSITIPHGGAEVYETVLQNKGLLVRNSSNVALARFEAELVLIPSVGITFSDLSVQTSAGITAATADSTYYPLSGNPSNFVTSSSLATTLGSYALRSGATFTGEIITAASTTTTAGLTLPHGTAPSTPQNGEIWTTTAGLFYQINGATISPATLAGGTFTGKITTATATTAGAGFRIPTVSAGNAPTTPTAGDMWIVSGVTGSLVFQGNGTQTVATLGYTQTFTGNNTFSGATLNFGNATTATTIGLGNGATATATTKTVNVGTAGTSGSTTVVNVGSSVSGATSTINLNGTVNAPGLANGVKAWVNFNGTGTVAIRASFNVSSITDNGVGDYTVNFTTALADANYAALATAKDATGTWTALSSAVAQTASAVRVQNRGTGSFVDTDTFCVGIIR